MERLPLGGPVRDPACRGSSLGPAQQEGQPPCLRGSIDRAPGSPAAARPSESPEGGLPGRQQSFSLRARGSLSYSFSSCPETAPNPPRWASAEPRRGAEAVHTQHLASGPSTVLASRGPPPLPPAEGGTCQLPRGPRDGAEPELEVKWGESVPSTELGPGCREQSSLPSSLGSGAEGPAPGVRPGD